MGYVPYALPILLLRATQNCAQRVKVCIAALVCNVCQHFCLAALTSRLKLDVLTHQGPCLEAYEKLAAPLACLDFRFLVVGGATGEGGGLDASSAAGIVPFVKNSLNLSLRVLSGLQVEAPDSVYLMDTSCSGPWEAHHLIS